MHGCLFANNYAVVGSAASLLNLRSLSLSELVVRDNVCNSSTLRIGDISYGTNVWLVCLL